MAAEVDDIEDVEVYYPGLLDATRDWFRHYKIPDGKDVNEIGLQGQFQNKR